jgi:hypothetical protein
MTWSDGYDFSLVLGGPLYQIFRRTHLSGDVLELLSRRILALGTIAWLPLLILTALEGTAWGHAIKLPFLADIDAHVRFLIALPLLIVAELVVHQRMRLVVRQFLERGLVPDDARQKFDAAISSARRLRDSVLAEVLLIAIIYAAAVLLFRRAHALPGVVTWRGAPVAGLLQPSLAGWCFGYISLPLFQFLLLRWYYRLFIWARFLWQVSRINLALIPTHPDRAGGLGFLSMTSHAFTPLLLAQGALVAGVLADRILFAGAKLPQFRAEVVAVVVVAIFVVLGPLLIFVPRLAKLKRSALADYGTLAQRYVREFDQKWVRGGAAKSESLLGSPDIQSLADLGNSYDLIRALRPVPVTKQTFLQLTVATLAPMTPLLLTMISLQELLQRALKVLF